MREASRTLLYRHDYVTTKNTLGKSAAYKANQQIMICTFKRLYARRGFNVRSPFPHLPGTEMSDESKDKPVLLKAVELVLANPKDIQREAQSLVAKFTAKHEDKSADQVRKLVAKKIISNYSYYSACTAYSSDTGKRYHRATFCGKSGATIQMMTSRRFGCIFAISARRWTQIRAVPSILRQFMVRGTV